MEARGHVLGRDVAMGWGPDHFEGERIDSVRRVQVQEGSQGVALTGNEGYSQGWGLKVSASHQRKAPLGT